MILVIANAVRSKLFCRVQFDHFRCIVGRGTNGENGGLNQRVRRGKYRDCNFSNYFASRANTERGERAR